MEDNIFDKIHESGSEEDHGEVLYRLCHERDRFQGPSGCAGWI